MTESPYAVTAPGSLLPDIPGHVHGIVQLDPVVWIQCDGCGYIHVGQPRKAAFAILTCGIRFSPRRYHRPEGQRDRRRLCPDCRLREWGESDD